MKLHGFKPIALCTLAISLCQGALGAPKHNYGPELTVDLVQFGYAVPKHRGQFVFSTSPDYPMTFLDDRTLAISMFVRNRRPGMSVRDKVFGGEYLFQTVFLDASTGKQMREQQWSNATTESGLFPAPDGGFVVWHDFELILYAADGTITKKLRLDRKRFSISVSMKESLSGRTLFAKTNDRSGEHVLCIRTQDIEPFAWLDLTGYFGDDGTDSHFAFVTAPARSGNYPPTDLYVTKFDNTGPSILHRKAIFTTPQPGCLSVTFLDDQSLALSSECHSLIIVSRSGKVLYRKDYGKDFVHRVLACRTCSLLVSGTYTYRGGNAFLDIMPKGKEKNVILFDRSTEKAVEFPYPGKIHTASSEALSPDGCFLAIQIDSVLRIYHTCNSPIGDELRSPSQR